MVSNLKKGVQAELRGFFQQGSGGRELVRGHRVRTGYAFLDFVFYRFDNLDDPPVKPPKVDPKVMLGRAKIYVTDADLGIMGDGSSGVFYYMSSNPKQPTKDWQTPIIDVNKLFGMPAGIRGILKEAESPPDYTHFMNKVEKIKLFVDPNTGKPLIAMPHVK